jgi:RNA polymerase primary sigma factor
MKYLRSLKYYESHELGKGKKLSNEEQFELGDKIRAGDKEALDKLIVANLPLVYKLAKSWHIKGHELSDLISEGNLALIKAAHDYDSHNKTVYFTYYASICIKSAFNNMLKKNHVQISSEVILENVGDDNADPAEEYELNETIQNVRDDLGKLTEIERTIVNRVFSRNERESIENIGKSMNMSRKRTREIYERALSKIKKFQKRRYHDEEWDVQEAG